MQKLDLAIETCREMERRFGGEKSYCCGMALLPLPVEVQLQS